jgi:uncharacterized membrane protein
MCLLFIYKRIHEQVEPYCRRTVHYILGKYLVYMVFSWTHELKFLKKNYVLCLRSFSLVVEGSSDTPTYILGLISSGNEFLGLG